ncbi:hypothetical protein [Billgrantia bachuensis]|uniref:Internal virion protein n=1 Tax=Billgrantia bachuensis TaxID=2717286 RepID=A0ABX0PTE6_9GAMM|nr:hypothetical protein [Halomonas bachuensis]NIC05755.1 hypothetical protein [Halomonas bachuensis]
MTDLIPSLQPSSIGRSPNIRENRHQEAAIEAERQSNTPSWGETWDAAKQRNFLYKSLDEMAERNRQELDPNYRVSEQDLKPLAREFNERELEFVAGAVNERDYRARLQAVDKNRANLETIQRAGLKGIGAEVLAGIVDPSALPLMFVTGGGSAAARATLLGQTLRAVGSGAVGSAGLERYLMKNDTTKDWHDVVLAGIGGGLVSGAIPVAVRPFRKSDGSVHLQPQRDSESWEAAVAVDSDLLDVTQAARAADLGDEIQRHLDNSVLTSRDSRQTLADELMPEAEQRLSRGARKQDEARIVDLEHGIRRIQEEEASTRLSTNPGVPNRQRRANAAENAARKEAMEARVRPLQEEIDNLRQRQADDAKYQEAWKDISRLQNGVIPARLKERFDALEEARMGPVAKAEREAAHAKAAAVRAERAAKEDAEQSTVVDPQAADKPAGSTVGAAQAQGAQFADEMHLVDEAGSAWEAIYDGVRLAERMPANWQNHLYPGQKAKDYLQSAFSTLDAAPSNLIRGLNIKLNANPQAGLKGHIPAAHYQDLYMRRAVNAEGGLEREAALEFAKSRGIPGWKMELGIAPERREFDNLVVLHMRGKNKSQDPAIAKAAEARAAMLKQSLEDRKAAGVHGYENVQHDGRYMPFILDTTKMQSAYRQYGEQAVEDVLAGAYQRGRIKLSENTARMVARAQMRRTLDKGLDSQTGIRQIFSEANREQLGKELRAAGMDEDAVNRLLDDMADVRLNESVSKRAKFSLGASMSYEHNGVRMVDLLNTSQDVVMNYVREGAGESALARQGFKTRMQADEAIDEAVRDARNLFQTQLTEARKAGDEAEVKRLARMLGDQNDGRLQQYAEMLHDSVRLLMGETLDTNYSSWTQGAIRASRGLRKATGILRLGWNGAASLAEASNSLVTFGLRRTLKNVPATRWFQVGKYREDPRLEAVHRIMGAYGNKENYFTAKNYMAANMGEDAQSKLERIYNNAAGYVQDKNMLLSGFRTIQNGSEELAQRSMLDQLLQAAEGKLPFKDQDLQVWRDAGLDDDEFHAVLDYIRKTPEHVDVDGKQVRVFSADSMDPELRDKLGAAMGAVLGRQMQRNFIGESSIWVNKELGKLLTQFRTFSLVSLEKQLMYGLRGNSLVLAQKLMWSTALAYLAYNGRVAVQSKLKDDPEEYVRQATDGMAEVIGVMNMNNIYGGFGIPMDGLATVNSLPGSWMSGGQSWGFKGYGLDSVPAAGVVGDAYHLTRGSMGALRSILAGENVEGEDAEQIQKRALRLMPLVNTAAVGTALSVIE